MTAKQLAPLDPDIAEMERRWRESGIPGFYVGRNGPVSRERARNVRAIALPETEAADRQARTVLDPGARTGRSRWRPFSRSREPPIGTLVYYHGGGYVIGDIDSHQAHAIRFANRSRVVVLNVDYRLAPEHPFPQGVNDAFAAARWASENLGKLGGADKPLALGGDSAGGNFAAVTAIRARDAGIRIAAQVLLYGASESVVATPMFSTCISALISVRKRRRRSRPHQYWRISKALRPPSSALARTTSSIEDSVAYAAKLREAGVRLIYREYPTLNHGFFGYTGISPACAAAADQLCDDLRSLLG